MLDPLQTRQVVDKLRANAEAVDAWRREGSKVTGSDLLSIAAYLRDAAAIISDLLEA